MTVRNHILITIACVAAVLLFGVMGDASLNRIVLGLVIAVVLNLIAIFTRQGVAQPGRAPRLGRGGQESESLRPDQHFDTCSIAPVGWRCTRERGHEGPCAAVPEDEFGGKPDEGEYYSEDEDVEEDEVEKIEVGTIVSLKSGSRTMTVIGFGDETKTVAICAYFHGDEDERYSEVPLPVAALSIFS